MARYIYTAKSGPGKTVNGEIDAESVQDAINKLNRLGYFPISVQPEESSLEKRAFWPFRKVPRKDIVLFTTQLSTLVGSGVNIMNSLSITTNQIPNKYLKSVLGDVASRVKDGKSLSESLSNYPALFSSLYTSLLRSGEAAGTMDETLKRLSEFMEKEEDLKDTIVAAMTYPFFIFAVSTLTVGILLGFVIPKLVSMFEDMGQALPLPTKILVSISGILRAYWWFVPALIIILIFVWQRLKQKPKARLYLDRLKLRLPLLGTVILKTEISRMTRTLSLLISGGLTITSALDISTSVVGNEMLRQEASKFKDQIASGANLSDALKNSKFFPDFTVNIVAIGEETGSLEKSLMRIAQDYEKEVDRAMKGLTRLLEPIIILVMGIIVAFIVLSMLLPIFQINLVVR